MDAASAIPRLEKEWEQLDGFLGRLRLGSFDPDGLERLVNILQSIELTDATKLDRRFVELTWYIPLFMSWQRERVQEGGGDAREVDIATNKVLTLLHGILGIP